MFSVVILAYNCAKTIIEVLDSVMLQTRLDLIEEIIIINDGSNGNTEKLIKGYILNHTNKQFVYRNQKNKDSSMARDIGIRMTKGYWIVLQDSDDIWMKNKIERQYEEVQRNLQIIFLGANYPVQFVFKRINGRGNKAYTQRIVYKKYANDP